MSEPHDMINDLAGIAEGSLLAELRRQRPEAAQFAQGSYAALLEPSDPAGLSRIERELAALRTAALTGSAALVAHHQARLRQLGASENVVELDKHGAEALTPRQAAIVHHVELLTLTPRQASQAAVDDLRASGLSARDIVTLAQLVAFVTFQARVITGLRLLGEERR